MGRRDLKSMNSSALKVASTSVGIVSRIWAGCLGSETSVDPAFSREEQHRRFQRTVRMQLVEGRHHREPIPGTGSHCTQHRPTPAVPRASKIACTRKPSAQRGRRCSALTDCGPDTARHALRGRVGAGGHPAHPPTAQRTPGHADLGRGGDRLHVLDELKQQIEIMHSVTLSLSAAEPASCAQMPGDIGLAGETLLSAQGLDPTTSRGEHQVRQVQDALRDRPRDSRPCAGVDGERPQARAKAAVVSPTKPRATSYDCIAQYDCMMPAVDRLLSAGPASPCRHSTHRPHRDH
jgi:hypothetical protein